MPRVSGGSMWMPADPIVTAREAGTTRSFKIHRVPARPLPISLAAVVPLLPLDPWPNGAKSM